MNLKMVFKMIGWILQIEAALMLLPAVTSVVYKEYSVAVSFLIVCVGAFALGTLISILVHPKDHIIYAKEGFTIVAIAWIAVSAVGALPFVASGDIPSYTDAFFETVSGFTTTGSSILKDVEALSHGALFWRSLTHWIGGMGFLVFVVAVIPNVSGRTMHILRAEMPGPVVGKIVPRTKDTAKILYLIYMVMTIVEIIMLIAGGMPVFDSLLHSFGTAGTGGFGIKADSIASYSPYCQWVIAVFMLLFGINFNIYYLMLIRKFKSALKSSEMWYYLSIVAVSTGIIILNTASMYERLSKCIRDSFFQVSSIITTTGYATADFDKWPGLSKAIILILMFVGACAGSTGGGLKVSRAVLLFKMIGRQVRKLTHPRSVGVVRFEGRNVDEKTLDGLGVYFAAYMIFILMGFLIISFEPFGMETNFTAVVSCFNNIGPGLAKVGPTMSFADYSALSKFVLSGAMLLGRLEIFPLIIAFSPSTWVKSKQ